MLTTLLTLLTTTVPLPPASGTDSPPDWLQFYGDIRVAGEATMDQNTAGEDQTRGRLRFRLGALMDLSEELRAEVRMTTSSGDANDPEWDIGGGSGDSQSGADVTIDRINLSWRASDSMTLMVGKYGNPFATNPVYGEWTWDGDVQHAGLFGSWRSEGNLDMDLRFGHTIVDEVNDPGDTADAQVTSLQVNLNGGEEITWGLSTMVSDWSNADAFTASAEDFLVWDTVFSASSGDLTASFEFIQNLDDNSGDDQGMALGFLFGPAGSQGDSQFSASYFDFDDNAFVGEVGQDDLPLAGPGSEGFMAGWEYWCQDNVAIKVSGMQADDDTVDPFRARIDINVTL
jgi:hypothetical protein